MLKAAVEAGDAHANNWQSHLFFAPRADTLTISRSLLPTPVNATGRFNHQPARRRRPSRSARFCLHRHAGTHLACAAVAQCVAAPGAFTFIATQAQPAYAESFPSLNSIISGVVGQVVNQVLGPILDRFFIVNGQLTNADFGLDAIDNNLDHIDFGLVAQVTDPDYGLERIAEDTQHSDFGLEMIDDEVEFTSAQAMAMLSHQVVDVEIVKAKKMTYVKTSEAGKPVNVDFLKVDLLSGMKVTSS